MTIQTYLEIIDKRFKTGISREHTYRGDLQTLLMTLLPDILVTNEPAHISCGAPDYLLSRKDIPVGYIEAKDIGIDLNSKTLKEQFERYKAGLTNLIFTDYLQFHFYKEGIFITSVSLAKIEHGTIIPLPENFPTFESLIRNFVLTVTQSIKSPTRLAEMMAGKARLMADVILKSLNSDDENDITSNLKKQMLSFKGMLIHDITNQGFADIYSQTIAYGLFAARYHDPTLEDFSRQEAANLIPKSNPFLRKLFQDIAGYDLDSRLLWIVEELISIFLASDVAKIMKNFGKSTKQEDPVVHFYETFLAAYNPALRKAKGVWYTPQPVVNFIINAADAILKDEFNLSDGLADTSKTKIKLKIPTHDRRYTAGLREYEQEIHKVQILDPATGTGTFIAEVVKHIYKKFEGQQGIWSNYVIKNLIPRLNGFELLMASYAMAHLKIDMLLSETGYKTTTDQRFRIFLTNSLEEAHPDTGTLFSSWLSDEADQANAVKRDTPVMVILGNPPYSISSTNKSDWIMALLRDYKKDLFERKINIDDDYIKFIRFGHHYIDKAGEGILAYITNNSFIDGITHRQMRKNLMETFDKIYILDLHGSAKKNEVTLNGNKDENVFDIQQGVSINIFIKNKVKQKDKLSELFHFDLYGTREEKYDFLTENHINQVSWKKILPTHPYYFFVPKNFESIEEYNLGFSLTDLFLNTNSGIQTKSDDICIQFDSNAIEQVLSNFENNSISDLKHQYHHKKDSSGWNFKDAQQSLAQGYQLTKINYRPFDDRFTAYTKNSGGFIGRPRTETMKHIIGNENISLVTCRQQSTFDFQHIFLSKLPTDLNSISLQTKEQSYIFPLYIYNSNDSQISLNTVGERTLNFNTLILEQIEKSVSLPLIQTAIDSDLGFSPLDLLDYIYAVLHSTKYRQKFKEFLKIDFPKIPFPKMKKNFFDLASKGKELRELHLLEHSILKTLITHYPVDGNNFVVKPLNFDGKIYINETQYFDNVPDLAWNFYIGGYQPAQKWLKDRKGRILEYDDILHYQKIIVALTETARLMEEIDLVINI